MNLLAGIFGAISLVALVGLLFAEKSMRKSYIDGDISKRSYFKLKSAAALTFLLMIAVFCVISTKFLEMIVLAISLVAVMFITVIFLSVMIIIPLIFISIPIAMMYYAYKLIAKKETTVFMDKLGTSFLKVAEVFIGDLGVDDKKSNKRNAERERERKEQEAEKEAERQRATYLQLKKTEDSIRAEYVDYLTKTPLRNAYPEMQNVASNVSIRHFVRLLEETREAGNLYQSGDISLEDYEGAVKNLTDCFNALEATYGKKSNN